jgi:hypothetical protein
MTVHILPHAEINKEKYNHTLQQSPNGVLYADSWYLDTVAPGWKLLVADNYAHIMPLPQKTKFGIPYHHQPLMCQQLGIFSPQPITEAHYRQMIRRLPFASCHLHLNTGNRFKQKETRPNYVLDLRPDYPTHQSRYHRDTRAALKKNQRLPQETNPNLSLDEALAFTRQYSLHYTGTIYNTAQQLILRAQNNGSLYLRSVQSTRTAETLALVFFIRWRNRFYYLLSVSSPAGRQAGSMRLLVDRFIAEFAGQDCLLDFEGSAIPGVARFYHSFGARKETYPVYQNCLGALFRRLIK